ncbi:choline ethanolaminephosphotransferase [Endogone sp. FLAS-F59071]|nr:choline ethanolaminephosphotransferase [Endogone sp. FLAS-F59071]|eukprot:RUS20467.1 choline ethanolaminephosphotransferase [Endogone sp. FLAS-F59071]
MAYIIPEYRKNLSSYRYSGVDKSLVSRYVLSKYWSWLITLFPLSVAPNLITLSGLVCVLINMVTLFYYSPDLGPCPRWVHLTFALGLWIYQSLDAIDGKQARRTGTSGPLGELFDHGNQFIGHATYPLKPKRDLIYIYPCGYYLRLRRIEHNARVPACLLIACPWSVMVHSVGPILRLILSANLNQCLGLANFYLSTWEEYHTGTLYLSYFSGPVEGILIIIAVHIISGIYGAEFWLQPMGDIAILPAIVADALPPFIAEIQLNKVSLASGALGLSANIIAASFNVYRAALANKRPIFPALSGLIPFFSSSAIAYLWLISSPSIVTKHLIPFALYIGCSFGYQVGLIILAHVTKAPFPFMNLMMVPLIVGCVNANLPVIAGIQPFFTGDKEAPFLWAAFAFSLAYYLHFSISVINDLCDYFDINCLTIKHKKQENGDSNKSDEKKNM